MLYISLPYASLNFLPNIPLGRTAKKIAASKNTIISRASSEMPFEKPMTSPGIIART